MALAHIMGLSFTALVPGAAFPTLIRSMYTVRYMWKVETHHLANLLSHIAVDAKLSSSPTWLCAWRRPEQIWAATSVSQLLFVFQIRGGLLVSLHFFWQYVIYLLKMLDFWYREFWDGWQLSRPRWTFIHQALTLEYGGSKSAVKRK